MFGWVKKKSYAEEAERLLQFSQILSTASTTSVLDSFPAIEQIFSQPGFSVQGHWDFFVTCACIGTGLSLYSLDRPNDIRPFAMELLQQAARWDQQAAKAINDFQVFVNRNISSGIDLPTSIGSWVVWNLKGTTPTQSGLNAAPAIGALIVNGLRDWHKS